ncbi:hypothetical protein ZIOFF_011231 [Zingiber officinale]|uniref:Uncharacterized protein n=1 Tax=Zingiber officinale TaxID=94328 RepID=A0A8J5M0U0_ZINOF|nr:hypothetical protein ZIOFF_011231 [Zingiber officinale]
METANSKGGERPATSSPCWKKKEPDAGFLDDVKDHLGQFVSTSMDQHRICLKKSIRGISDYASSPSASSSSDVASESNPGSKNAEMDAS